MENILDVGCGSGDLAQKIANTRASVIGIDLSENMSTKGKEKYPYLTFLVRDITKLDYHNEFDALFSNATLHWINEPEKELTNISKGLKKEEHLSLSLVGKVMAK